MKRILLLSIFLTVSICTAQTTINKVLQDFSTLKIYNGIDVELVKSEEQRIEITGEKADKVTIKEEDNTLKIALRFPETVAEGKVKITLFFNKDIAILDANEGATLTGKDIHQTTLEVKAQEGAFINLVVETKHLYVKSSSGGVIMLSGTTQNQDVSVDLGGAFHGYKLNTSHVSTVKAGSGAKAEVNVGQTLDARVTFGGSIFYKGTPEVLKDKKIIGGTIEQRD